MSTEPTQPGMLQRITSTVKGWMSQMPGAGPSPDEQQMAGMLKALGFGFADQAITYVENEYQRRLTEMRPWHLEWRLNIAYIHDEQFMGQDATGTDLVERSKEFWWQTRKVHNQIAPIYDTRVSKLARTRVIMKARPSSTELKDVSAAKVSYKVLAGNEHDQEWPRKYSEAVSWLEAAGTVITKETWDPGKGRLLGYMTETKQPDEVPRDPSTPAGNSDEPLTIQKPVREGDVNTVVCSPFTILPDSPWHGSVEECGSILEARAYRVEDIYQLWNVLVEPEEVTVVGVQQSANPGAGNAFRFGTARLRGHAVVKELWERPSARYPEGRYIVVCSRKLLHIGPLPYKCGRDNTPDLPYTFWWSIRRVGCLLGVSVVKRARPLQDRWNEIRNLEADYVRRVGIGQWDVEEGAYDLDTLEQDGGSPGFIHVRRKGFSPIQPVQFPSLPASLETQKATLLSEFISLTGVSDLAKTGAAPPGVKSGVALSLALEQDDTRMAQTVENIAQASVESGKKRLRLYRQFAQGRRMARVVGANDEVDVLFWEASDLSAEDLYVENISALAESPAQRRQMVFDLLKTGIFNDSETGTITREGRDRILEMLQLGDWEDASDTDRLQGQKQDRENRRLLEDKPVTVSDIDDDIIHLTRLTRFMLSSDYEEAVMANPAVEQAFLAHREMHLARLAQKAGPSGNALPAGQITFSASTKDPTVVDALIQQAQANAQQAQLQAQGAPPDLPRGGQAPTQ